MSVDIQRIKEQVLKHSEKLDRVTNEVRKVLVGPRRDAFEALDRNVDRRSCAT